MEWVNADPRHRSFEIRFNAVDVLRPRTQPPEIPLIGVGDLLRYGGQKDAPIPLPYPGTLCDLDQDGSAELVGVWNYAYRPGWPWNSIVAYPRIHDPSRPGSDSKRGFHFGEMLHLRYTPESKEPPRMFGHEGWGAYSHLDAADLNGDGLIDLVSTHSGAPAEILLNTGRRELTGMPMFLPSGRIETGGWDACRIVDLDGNKSLDLVVDGRFIENRNPNGWPFDAAPPQPLDAGRRPCFLDVDHDGLLDAICLHGGETVQPDFHRVAWRRNEGGRPAKFGAEQLLNEIDVETVSYVAAFREGETQGLLVQHNVYQDVSFFELLAKPAGPEKPQSDDGSLRELKREANTPIRFARRGRAESRSAVMGLSDQAWPCLCDWDGDGDLDLLVGGGYGWPRIVLNTGTTQQPVFAEPQLILSENKPIRLVRNELLGEPKNWHDMGYPYPTFADWDSDGLPDLLFPNETNRLYWYRNLGTRQQPKFGPRQQILCEGFADNVERRTESARRAADPKSNNGVYPYEDNQPFFWRTGAAFADWNGDGLMDLITHSGNDRHASLFVQQRDDQGALKLRATGHVTLADGRPIDDRLVGREAHWTESFRAVDWNSDGLMDLVYSCAGSQGIIQDSGSIFLLLNCGHRNAPRFEPPRTMCVYGRPIRVSNHGPHPWVGDFDGDNQPDLLTCVESSVYPFYRHAVLTMASPPEVIVGKAELIIGNQ